MPDSISAAGKRPVGATITSLLLGWTALGSIANAFIWWNLPPELLEKAPELRQLVVELDSSVLLRTSLMVSGIAGVAASIGIWRMKAWMLITTTIWALSTLVSLLGMLQLPSFAPPDAWASAMFVVISVAIVGALCFYIRRLALVAGLSRVSGTG